MASESRKEAKEDGRYKIKFEPSLVLFAVLYFLFTLELLMAWNAADFEQSYYVGYSELVPEIFSSVFGVLLIIATGIVTLWLGYRSWKAK